MSLRIFLRALLPLCLLCTEASGRRQWSLGNASAWTAAGGQFEGLDVDTRPGWMRPDSISTRDNLALGAIGRGGGVSSPQGIMLAQEAREYEGGKGENLMNNMVDGDLGTVFEMDDESARGTTSGFVELDLGDIIPGVARIRFYPRPNFTERFMRGYEVAVNDGSPQSVGLRGALIWDQVARNDDNFASTVELEIPPQPVRYIKLQSRTTLPWEVAEIEVEGGGFVRRATYISEVIDLTEKEGGVANLGRIKWADRVDPGARLEIRTRSGNTADPFVYFALVVQEGDTLEVPLPDPGVEGTARQQYDRLVQGVRRRRLDTDQWSFWSFPYAASGEAINSPSPRRFVQFNIDYFSEVYTDRVELDSLAFDFSTPIMAHNLRATIRPPLVPAGEEVPFAYHLQMEVRDDDTGFNGLEVVTPVAVSSLGDFAIDGAPAALDSLRIGSDSFRIYFPRITRDHPSLSFNFTGQVLVYGTHFASRVFDRQAPDEVPQAPDPEASRLAVNVVLNNVVLRGATAAPNPFTPNGDGVNDHTAISYQVLKILEPVPIVVDIIDLAQLRVRRYEQRQAFGIHRLQWDGRDDSGAVVPPGLYLYRVEVDSQTAVGVAVGTLAVVY